MFRRHVGVLQLERIFPEGETGDWENIPRRLKLLKQLCPTIRPVAFVQESPRNVAT